MTDVRPRNLTPSNALGSPDESVTAPCEPTLEKIGIASSSVHAERSLAQALDGSPDCRDAIYSIQTNNYHQLIVIWNKYERE